MIGYQNKAERGGAWPCRQLEAPAISAGQEPACISTSTHLGVVVLGLYHSGLIIIET